MAKTIRKKTQNLVSMPRPAAPAPSTDRIHPTADAIAERAFAIYRARGYRHGHDVDDWLQAERELREAARSTAA